MCATTRSHLCFFFFQAEDGIRDLTVTGVQTCALPICRACCCCCRRRLRRRRRHPGREERPRSRPEGKERWSRGESPYQKCIFYQGEKRSEERRGGKEWRSRWSPDH